MRSLFLVVLTLLSPSLNFVLAQDDDDLKKYSYVCLQSDQNLCMGISPGEGDPFYDPDDIFYLQVKNREKNENASLDYKKMRW